MKADPLLRLQDLCARSEQCVSDLRRKLAQWKVSDAESERIIGELIEGRFVDDERYARAFASDKARFERWGRLKIRVTLAIKHIPSCHIDSAIAAINDDVFAQGLMATLRAKKRQLGPDASTFDGKGKLYKAALQRGYEPALVIEALKSPELWEEE